MRICPPCGVGCETKYSSSCAHVTVHPRASRTSAKARRLIGERVRSIERGEFTDLLSGFGKSTRVPARPEQRRYRSQWETGLSDVCGGLAVNGARSRNAFPRPRGARALLRERPHPTRSPGSLLRRTYPTLPLRAVQWS